MTGHDDPDDFSEYTDTDRSGNLDAGGLASYVSGLFALEFTNPLRRDSGAIIGSGLGFPLVKPTSPVKIMRLVITTVGGVLSALALGGISIVDTVTTEAAGVFDQLANEIAGIVPEDPKPGEGPFAPLTEAWNGLDFGLPPLLEWVPEVALVLAAAYILNQVITYIREDIVS